MVEFDEILNSPGFWLLGGGAVAATILGWKMSAGMGASFTWWQLLIIIVVELGAAAFFSQQG